MTYRIALTGISGYVGKQIASLLVEWGHQVTGGCRRNFSLPRVPVRCGSLTDPEFLASLLRDQDIVVHAAALTRSRDPRALRDANERVTECLLDACAKASIKRFIFLSTDQAARPTGAYGISKKNCEDLVRQKARDYVILRLAPVLGEYAPDENSTFSKIIRRMSRDELLLLPAGGNFPVAPVSIEDIAAVIDRVVCQHGHLQKTYGLCGETGTLIDFVALVAERLGRPVHKLSVPLSPLKAAALAASVLPVSINLPVDSILNIGTPVPVNTDDLRRDFEFRPRPLREIVASITRFPGSVASATA